MAVLFETDNLGVAAAQRRCVMEILVEMRSSTGSQLDHAVAATAPSSAAPPPSPAVARGSRRGRASCEQSFAPASATSSLSGDPSKPSSSSNLFASVLGSITQVAFQPVGGLPRFSARYESTSGSTSLLSIDSVEPPVGPRSVETSSVEASI
eukprot:CAMPEP_0182525518 /NCGR_PEP_ID=MMETSP1323-20130603/2539_1 /TAXON_ID=236787 /ORGANISM="Florenciella parvula, Strain RCC1693" /LENGTH=151 /DNA_ID=CAMNT_0024734239 /DNA_START=220 /DNA_END=676 /DNA_ORIENTATION=-